MTIFYVLNKACRDTTKIGAHRAEDIVVIILDYVPAQLSIIPGVGKVIVVAVSEQQIRIQKGGHYSNILEVISHVHIISKIRVGALVVTFFAVKVGV